MDRHALLMLACCIIPIIIAAILYIIGFKEYALIAVFLLCPLMHFMMMKEHNGEKGKNAKRQEEKCH